MKEPYCEQLESGALRFTRVLPGPIERVWEFLIDPVKRELWFCGGTSGHHAGDTFTLHFNHDTISPEKRPAGAGPGGTEMQAVIVDIEPPHLLVMRWGPEDEETRFELSEDGELVKLVLVQDPPADFTTMISIAAGWHTHIGILIDHLGGDPHRGFWSEHAEAEKYYAEALKPTP